MDTLQELEHGEAAARARFAEWSDASQWVRMLVSDARAEGATWQEIGDAVGLTRQGAQQRFSEVL